MKPETLKALKASIRHWKRMQKMTLRQRTAKHPKEQPNSEHCALCRRFVKGLVFCYQYVDGDRVEKCPVFELTGERGCNGSPWRQSQEAFYNSHDKAWRHQAQQEIDFLESLLPKKAGCE